MMIVAGVLGAGLWIRVEFAGFFWGMIRPVRAGILEPSAVPALTGTTPLPDSVLFAVIGDYGNGSNAEAAVASLVDGWQPDFVATVGDNNYPVGATSTIDDHIGQFYHSYIGSYVGSYGPGAATNRFFPALGNHDWASLSCSGGDCSGPFFDYFSLPGNERTYDLVQGPVHLFFLDSDFREPDGRTSTSSQAEWLRTGLAASKSAWNLVLLHHPPYSSSSAHGSVADLQWPFAEWGADAVIAGHDHTYERIVVDGFPYFVNGLGGAGRYGMGTPAPGSEVRYNADYGAMLVAATTDTIVFQFVNVHGDVIDSFRLDAVPPTPVPVCLSVSGCPPVYLPLIQG
jgi:hypothetical protein